ncbi:MAG: 16S rRNA (cytosine(1402)-N(4))-methyltransferase RsmH [Actinobacteria bacterium]|nr:16S rRNA (cytosine(1402)-N(4))-methyltransferase RsmH [Cyanobacteriota bacterium]MCL6087631.1 16S rRNA (cytosine(1402)-N(4))-methyltransferase RsmH [Actinomycetota bacterium]
MKLEQIHIPVLLKEVLEYLNLKPGDVVFDGTLGGAGHSLAILKAIAPTGKLIAVDQDSQAVSTAARLFKDYRNVYLAKGNFADVKKIINSFNVSSLDGFLLDLGLSSFQIDRSGKGFSYIRNEKLDMRMDEDNPVSAFNIVNEYSSKKLKEIFFKFGEEKYSERIAENVILWRKKKPVETTGELSEIIEKSIPAKEKFSKRGHPSKRIFQAIRIEVNRELDNLEEAIDDGFEVLNKGGKMAIISYHSLEDRIVKNKFINFSGKCICPADLPVCMCGAEKKAEILTRRVVKPTLAEIAENKRASSAKLRAIKKL